MTSRNQSKCSARIKVRIFFPNTSWRFSCRDWSPARVLGRKPGVSWNHFLQKSWTAASKPLLSVRREKACSFTPESKKKCQEYLGSVCVISTQVLLCIPGRDHPGWVNKRRYKELLFPVFVSLCFEILHKSGSCGRWCCFKYLVTRPWPSKLAHPDPSIFSQLLLMTAYK